MKKSINKKKLAIIITISTLAFIFLIALPIVIGIIYSNSFGRRLLTPKWNRQSPSNYVGLNMEEVSFLSNKKQRLQGYKFSKDNQKVNGVIIISHGLGSGFNNYMMIAHYFTSNDYLVFGYDATGNDNSEGKCPYGLPQGTIDLDYAIRYVEQDEDYKNLPIMLLGHSWGGYSITNVLNVHPEVKAVASFAGMNKSHDLIKYQGEKLIGKFINIAIPYIDLYERLKFGKYATFTAEKGFANSDAKVMVIHGSKDDVVPLKYGYSLWEENHKEDPRFLFKLIKGKGHNSVFQSNESIKYKKHFITSYFDYIKKEGLKDTPKAITDYCKKENFDVVKYNALDLTLMDEVKAFFDSAI